MELDLPLPAECWMRYRLAYSTLASVGQQFVYDVQLVVAREDLLADWMSGDVWFLDDLCVVLDDVGETLAREYVMP